MRLARGDTKTPSSIVLDGGATKDGTNEVVELFNGIKFFSYPNPVSLIKKLTQYGTEPNESHIVLDFFAGSGTIAHAVLELNEQDGGNRQVVCVQMPELLEENSEAYK